MPKTISQLYHDAHRSIGLTQNRKYGNPITEAPAHVPGVLERAIGRKLLTEAQARKLATQLGRLAYGEFGLTHGRVAGAVENLIPNSADVPWHVRAQFVSELEGHS